MWMNTARATSTMQSNYILAISDFLFVYGGGIGTGLWSRLLLRSHVALRMISSGKMQIKVYT